MGNPSHQLRSRVDDNKNWVTPSRVHDVAKLRFILEAFGSEMLSQRQTSFGTGSALVGVYGLLPRVAKKCPGHNIGLVYIHEKTSTSGRKSIGPNIEGTSRCNLTVRNRNLKPSRSFFQADAARSENFAQIVIRHLTQCGVAFVANSPTLPERTVRLHGKFVARTRTRERHNQRAP